MRPSNGSITPRSEMEAMIRASTFSLSAAAKASMVNRTHRVVRERARALQANRTAVRGLLLPMLLCATLMLTLVSALWMLLDQYDLVSAELPESIHHFFLLLVWFLPVSGGLGAMVWSRRGTGRSSTEAIQ